MDYGKLTLDELKKGYRYDNKRDAFVCNYCEQAFHEGQIFQIENRFYAANYAIIKHIHMVHGGNVKQLLESDTKYNSLTNHQKDLLALFHLDISDKEIAKKMGVSETTIRHQRFTFREKAKQAKFYLSVYEQVFEEKCSHENAIVPIHNTATMVDDRYITTEKEKAHILSTAFQSLSPLRLKDFSPKAKKKVIILARIAEEFEFGKKYTEKEVIEILKGIYDDHGVLRRYLVEYGFMDRTNDGKEYWLK